MNPAEIQERVLTVVALALKTPVTLATRRETLPAWDSLKHIELVFALEDELGIRFDEEQLAALDGVQELVDAAVGQACGTTI